MQRHRALACLHHGVRARVYVHVQLRQSKYPCARVYVQVKTSGFLDAYIIKGLYVVISNLVVLFLIIVIMRNIPSRGLPGRQQIDGTTFTVVQPCEQMFLELPQLDN